MPKAKSQTAQAAEKATKAKAGKGKKNPSKKRGRTAPTATKKKSPAPVKPVKKNLELEEKTVPSTVEELREEAAELQDAIAGLGPDEAKALLDKIVPAREEIDILKAERAEEVAKLTASITAVRGQIDRKLEQARDGKKITATAALSVIEKHWRKLGKLEADRDQLRKSFGKRIKAAEKRYRDALDGIRQRELPFGEAA